MPRVKYIRTKNNEIIVFSELQQHKEFELFEPMSAGFIAIGVNKDGNPTCDCYGESVSLGLQSDCKNDTKLAMRQIMGYEYDLGEDL